MRLPPEYTPDMFVYQSEPMLGTEPGIRKTHAKRESLSGGGGSMGLSA